MEVFSWVQSIWTVLVFVIFISIVLWAWSRSNKSMFDEAAQQPLDDDDAPGHNLVNQAPAKPTKGAGQEAN